MAKKEEFKKFVQENPKLANYVRTGEMSWQKFYEIYDIYGTEESVWKEYTELNPSNKASTAAAAAGGFGLAEVINMAKQLDLNSIQSGINNVQRVLGVFQDINTKNTETPEKESYKPRPIYKHFED